MTAVCIMEQFQNPTSMVFADRVLKDMGKAMASERYKVWNDLRFGYLGAL